MYVYIKKCLLNSLTLLVFVLLKIRYHISYVFITII